MLHIPTMEYNTPKQMNYLTLYVPPWMDCKNKILSKRSQTQNNSHYRIPFMLNSKTGKKQKQPVLFMDTYLASENHYREKEKIDYH